MEPFTIATISVISAVATKTWEKASDKVAEAIVDKAGKFLSSLRIQSPDTVTAIEKASEQPLDYGKAILEVESAVKVNPEIKLVAQELIEATQANPNPELQAIQQKISDSLKSQQPSVINNQKLADTIKNVFQGNTIIGGTF